MVLPLLKLGTLAVRTISKPIANRIKTRAGLHPRFKEFIISIAQGNHRMTTTMQRRIYSRPPGLEIRPLNEEKAVEAAVDLLGELFIFSVGVAVVIFEVQRAARSDAMKEEIRRKELERLRQRDEDLAKEVEMLKRKLAEVAQIANRRGLAGLFHFC